MCNIKRSVRIAIQFAVIAVFTAVDQVIKSIVEEKLAGGAVRTVITGILQFRYTINTGAALGVFNGNISVLSVVTAVFLAAILLYIVFIKKTNPVISVCLPFIAAGGFGNLIDRVFDGYVVDFIEPTFVNFAIFNFADCLITCGSFALIIYLLVDTFRGNHPIVPATGLPEESDSFFQETEGDSVNNKLPESPAGEPEAADIAENAMDEDGTDIREHSNGE